jgi:hypothetical protein
MYLHHPCEKRWDEAQEHSSVATVVLLLCYCGVDLVLL